eukprot:PITA_29849
MHETVFRYVRGCTMWAKSKLSNRKLGLYTPLPVPSRSSESVSMEFVRGLPKSRKGHDYLYVLVDRFSKMCILIPCNKQVTAKQTTKLFFQHVWVHFGLPTSIVSNRDSRFFGKFWSSLWELMDTRLKKSTTFHPQIDGQTERYPFETYFSIIPRSPLDFVFEKDIVAAGHSDVDKATRFIKHIQEIPQAVQEQLEKSQAKYKARHDKHRVEHNFQVGDHVWLYISKEKMQGEGKKLKPMRYGPFKVLEEIGENTFYLDLPAYMQIYSVINAKNLRLFEPSLIEDPKEQNQLSPIDDLFPKYLELQEDTVLDRKVRTTRRGDVKYLRVGFKGSKPSSSKWIEIGQVR